MKKIRFVSKPESGHVEIHAKLKTTGKYALFGTCHPATVPLIKRDGVKAHAALIRLPSNAFNELATRLSMQVASGELERLSAHQEL